MKKVLCILAVVYSMNCFAQENDRQPMIVGDILYTFRYENIQGHPFLNNDWTRAMIIMNDQKRYNDVQLKMDLYQNNFVFVRDEKNYTLTPDVAEVHLRNAANPGEDIIFKKGYDINKFIKAGNFVQVLAEGKMSFLKFARKSLEEFTEYNDATKYQRFKLVEQYYIRNNDQYVQVSLTKKNMETTFAAKWPQMDTWIRQNNISGREEASWAAATKYYNSLF